MVAAPLPERIIDKGLASNRVVVDTVIKKYCDHLPLYRQEAILRRDAGVEISRTTLDGWVMHVGELLILIREAMRRSLLSERYLQADETTVLVQVNDKSGKHHEGYLWQFGRPGGEVVFEFALGRGREVAAAFLGQWEGKLQTDASIGYDHVGGPKLIHYGCWSHYLDSGVIQSECRMGSPHRSGIAPAECRLQIRSQAFQEYEQLW